MIRKMNGSDIDAVVSLEKEVFTSPWPKDYYEYELYRNPFASLYVDEVNGKIAAYADWWIIYDRAEIASIAVAPEFRRQGYARRMMDFIIADARKNGCENVTLEVRVSNIPAQKLYESFGFITVNTRKNYYEDNGEDAYLMVMPL